MCGGVAELLWMGQSDVWVGGGGGIGCAKAVMDGMAGGAECVRLWWIHNSLEMDMRLDCLLSDRCVYWMRLFVGYKLSSGTV